MNLDELALELKDEKAVVMLECKDGDWRMWRITGDSIELITGDKWALATSEESRGA